MIVIEHLILINSTINIFTVKPGVNNVKRSSLQSTVTLPFERSFRSLANAPAAGTQEMQEHRFCGCG